MTKLFISHKVTEDNDRLIKELKQHLGPDVDVYAAEYDPQPGSELKKKIFSQIDSSEVVLVVLSENTIQSEWLNQEVGYAHKAKKLIVPLREKTVKIQLTGALEGLEWISLDYNNLPETVINIQSFVQRLKKFEITYESNEIYDPDKKSSVGDTILMVLGGIVIGVVLVFAIIAMAGGSIKWKK